MTVPKRQAPKNKATRQEGSVLERLVKLLGNPGVIVTAATKWNDLGLEGDSLDMFCRVQVSDEFGKPFEREDAGTKVGDLVVSINRALGT
jgi:hypothetical protein